MASPPPKLAIHATPHASSTSFLNSSPPASAPSFPSPPPSSSSPLPPSTPHLRRAVNNLSAVRRKVRERKSRVQQTFLLISSFTLIILMSLIVYFNYILLSPHLTSLFWAVLWSLVLSKPQQWMLSGLRWMDGRLEGRLTVLIASLTALALAWLAASPTLLSLVWVSAVYGLLLLLLLGDRPGLVSLVLLVGVVLVIAFPLFFFLKSLVEETQEIVARTRVFINQNPQFELLLRDFTSSPLYHSLLQYAEGWGYDRATIEQAVDLNAIKARLGGLISVAGEQLTLVLSHALSVVAQLGSTILSLLSFLSFLYFLLEHRAAFGSALVSLSPFSEEENLRLGGEMRRSVSSIFLCSFLIGLLHMVSTWVAFSLVGIDLCLILSFLAGFCSMLPVFSSWLVWLPAIVSMVAMQRYMQAAALACIQLFLTLYLDPLVYGRIQPGNQALIAMSIVLGLASFGATGAILGPLLTTVTVTLFNIYTEYLQSPLPLPLATPQSAHAQGTAGKTEGGAVSFPAFFHPAEETPLSLRNGVATLHDSPAADTKRPSPSPPPSAVKADAKVSDSAEKRRLSSLAKRVVAGGKARGAGADGDGEGEDGFGFPEVRIHESDDDLMTVPFSLDANADLDAARGRVSRVTVVVPGAKTTTLVAAVK